MYRKIKIPDKAKIYNIITPYCFMCTNTSFLGLALDDFDIDLYYNIFKNKAKRNPTNVELFDLAQSNR